MPIVQDFEVMSDRMRNLTVEITCRSVSLNFSYNY
jgi:hypothetical protein